MIGQTVDHYRITSKLGAGGMGEVFLAEDTRLERKAAIKFLPAEMAKDPERRQDHAGQGGVGVIEVGLRSGKPLPALRLDERGDRRIATDLAELRGTGRHRASCGHQHPGDRKEPDHQEACAHRDGDSSPRPPSHCRGS